jgi:hypothetical protein
MREAILSCERQGDTRLNAGLLIPLRSFTDFAYTKDKSEQVLSPTLWATMVAKQFFLSVLVFGTYSLWQPAPW